MRRIYTHPSGVALTKSQHAKLALVAKLFNISASEVIRRFLHPLWEVPVDELIVKGLSDEAYFNIEQAMEALQRNRAQGTVRRYYHSCPLCGRPQQSDTARRFHDNSGGHFRQ